MAAPGWRFLRAWEEGLGGKGRVRRLRQCDHQEVGFHGRWPFSNMETGDAERNSGGGGEGRFSVFSITTNQI